MCACACAWALKKYIFNYFILFFIIRQKTIHRHNT